MNFKRYPATLTVTLNGYKPDLSRSKSFSRPMSVLEEELTRDIYSEPPDMFLDAMINKDPSQTEHLIASDHEEKKDDSKTFINSLVRNKLKRNNKY